MTVDDRTTKLKEINLSWSSTEFPIIRLGRGLRKKEKRKLRGQYGTGVYENGIESSGRCRRHCCSVRGRAGKKEDQQLAIKPISVQLVIPLMGRTVSHRRRTSFFAVRRSVSTSSSRAMISSSLPLPSPIASRTYNQQTQNELLLLSTHPPYSSFRSSGTIALARNRELERTICPEIYSLAGINGNEIVRVPQKRRSLRERGKTSRFLKVISRSAIFMDLLEKFEQLNRCASNIHTKYAKT